MTSLINIFKALADESRLRILRVLLHGRYSVNELTDILRMGQSRVSRHLKLLMDAGLAKVRREGTWAYYETFNGDAGEAVALQLGLISRNHDAIDHQGEDESRRLACLEQRRARSKQFHEKVAPTWASLREELFGGVAVTDGLLASLDPAEVIVDLGCGAGALLPLLAQKARRVIGVDSSPAMLAQAEAERQAQEAPVAARIELRLGALEHLPLADREASAAVMNLVLHHLADPLAVLKEARRVLSADGRIVICDLARHDEEWMRERYGDQWLGFTAEELDRFLRQAGFEAVSIHRVPNTPRQGILLATARLGAPKS